MNKLNKSSVIKMIRENKYEDAAYELMKAMEPTEVVVDAPSTVWQLLRKYAPKKQEHFIVVFLNNKNVVIDHKVVSIGTISETIVHPREIFRDAIQQSCSSIIIAHNHPSGVLTPSKEDESMTKRVVEAGKLLGIRVLDHVIIGKSSFLSMREQDSISF